MLNDATLYQRFEQRQSFESLCRGLRPAYANNKHMVNKDKMHPSSREIRLGGIQGITT